MSSRRTLFPSLSRATFVHANLDAEARKIQPGPSRLVGETHPNPFLDSKVCDKFVESVARAKGADFTFGGYLEDRRFLWSQSYLDTTKNYLHLGIDFNVPAGTEVASLFSGVVVRVDDDYPTDSGWGPRVIVAPDNGGPYCIFAHLKDVRVQNGDKLVPGTLLGNVGVAPFNGNWYAHLHLQTVNRETFESFLENSLADLDGYGDEHLKDQFPTLFPNPLSFEWLVGAQFAADS